MKNVKCKKVFTVEKYDGDGFIINNQYMSIKEGSVWEIDDGLSRIIGGDVRLEDNNGAWLEISHDIFDEYFEVVE